MKLMHDEDEDCFETLGDDEGALDIHVTNGNIQ